MGLDQQKRLLKEAYKGVPSIDCTGCPGDCCVSPTMTGPEFVLLMHEAQNSMNLESFNQLISAPSREHFLYADNAFCRFQHPNGLCGNYTGRALACRLHGHEALRPFASADMEFCNRNPKGNTALLPQQAQDLVSLVQEALADASLRYEEPYYLLSLNLECWIDFYFHPEWSAHRPTLLPIREYLDQCLQIKKPDSMPTHTTLGGKLVAIDRLQVALDKHQRNESLILLDALLEDFPSCASYFIEEARQIKDLILNETTAD